MEPSENKSEPAPPKRGWVALSRDLADIALLLLGALSLLSLAAAVHWLPDMVGHFRLQYAAGLLVVTAWQAAHRQRRRAAAAAVLMALNLFGAGRAVVSARAAGSADGEGTILKVLVANVNSGNKNYEAIKRLIRDSGADLALLMEVTDDLLFDLGEIRQAYPYWIFQPRDDNFGIALLSRTLLEEGAASTIGPAFVPTIVTGLPYAGRRVFFVGTHPVPPGSGEYAAWRNEQLRDVARIAFEREAAGDAVILAGDLNCTPWSPYFGRLIRESGLKAAWGGWPAATWPVRPFFLRIPIDHLLVGSAWTVKSVERRNDFGSDHFAVLYELALKKGRETK